MHKLGLSERPLLVLELFILDFDGNCASFELLLARSLGQLITELFHLLLDLVVIACDSKCLRDIDTFLDACVIMCVLGNSQT